MNVLLIAAVPDPHRDPHWHEPDMVRAIDVREACVGIASLVAEYSAVLFVFNNPTIDAFMHSRLRNPDKQRSVGIEDIHDLAPKETLVFFAGGTDREVELFGRIKHWPFIFPFASTGKASATMLDEIEERLPKELTRLLKTETVYSHVARIAHAYVAKS